MNRRSFLVSIGLGALVLPAAVKAAGEPRVRTIFDWAESLHRGKPGVVKIVCGTEAMDAFREHYLVYKTMLPGQSLNDCTYSPHTKFQYDSHPRRYDENQRLVYPWQRLDAHKPSPVNPDYVTAKHELIGAVTGSVLHFALFERGTVKLVGEPYAIDLETNRSWKMAC